MAPKLALTDGAGTILSSDWAAAFVGLGARLSRYRSPSPDVRLVVALTVPTRELAALMIATGWRLTASQPPEVPPPCEVADLGIGSNVVLVTVGGWATTGPIISRDLVDGSPRILVAGSGSRWVPSKLALATAAPPKAEARDSRQLLSRPGDLVAAAGLADKWFAVQTLCEADIAIAGTKTWLTEESQISVRRQSDGIANTLEEILMPDDGRKPFCGSTFMSVAHLDEAILTGLRDPALLILDGNSAAQRLADVSPDVTVVVLDRSVADESSSDAILQLRSVAGTPSDSRAIRWPIPASVECLIFEAPR